MMTSSSITFSLLLFATLLTVTLAEIQENSNDVSQEATVEPVASSLRKCDKEYPRMKPNAPLYLEQVLVLV